MEFKDRVANKPNRVKLTYEDGGASVYATVDLADEPIEEGTQLNAINMNKLLNKEDNDYIVEQNTSGIWTYRKWASGIAECWGNIEYINIATSVALTSIPITCNKAYPIVFTKLPVVTCEITNHGGYNHIIVGVLQTKEQFRKVELLCLNDPQGTPISGYINISVKGRWK